jgi:hypothetical protein
VVERDPSLSTTVYTRHTRLTAIHHTSSLLGSGTL